MKNRMICGIVLMLLLCMSCGMTTRKTLLAKCNGVHDEYPADYNSAKDNLPFSRMISLHFFVYNKGGRSVQIPLESNGVIDTSEVIIQCRYKDKMAESLCVFDQMKKDEVISSGDSTRAHIRLYEFSLHELGIYDAPLDTILKYLSIQYVRKNQDVNDESIDFLIDYHNVNRDYRPRSEINVNYDYGL